MSGEGGIRTPGTLTSSTVFKAAAIDRSATSPKYFLYSNAVSVGFEPTVHSRTLVLQTSAIDHSANSPYQAEENGIEPSRVVNS
jgi:hypothetical protein